MQYFKSQYFCCFSVWQESSVFTLRKTNTVNKETIMSGRNKWFVGWFILCNSENSMSLYVCQKNTLVGYVGRGDCFEAKSKMKDKNWLKPPRRKYSTFMTVWHSLKGQERHSIPGRQKSPSQAMGTRRMAICYHTKLLQSAVEMPPFCSRSTDR